MKTNSVPIFVYGTLGSVRVVETLLGRSVVSADEDDEFPSAVIENYSRHPVKNYVYPAMIPNPKQQVHGYLIQNLSPLDIKLFDWFEGDEYERKLVQVSTGSSTSSLLVGGTTTTTTTTTNSNVVNVVVDAETYIWKPHLLNELELSKEWSFEKFCNKNLEWYLENTVRPCREQMVELGITTTHSTEEET